MRRLFIAGNWKMNKDLNESIELVRKLAVEVNGITNKDILVCPPFTSLNGVYDVIKDTNIKLGAQNLYFAEKGAYTGEIAPYMLKSVGCEFVIIGHSERREYFNETNDVVNKKIKIALENELKPIVCVGEKLEERESGITEKVVEAQIREGLINFTTDEMKNITIAYEPIWAIGTGKTATPEDAEAVHKFIRNILKDMFGDKTAEETRILYGGSVKPNNAAGLFAMEDIDGGLVGGASLDAESFSGIIKA